MVKAYAKSDIGKVREINQDSYYITEDQFANIHLYILADGMGGCNAGDIASKLAIKCAKSYIENNFLDTPKDKESLVQLIGSSMEYANMVIYEKSLENKQNFEGMGTTLEICLIYNNKAYIGHIGDSRVYRIRKEFMRRITRDHSYVQTLIEDGKITKEEALHHPKRNMLTKALGCMEQVEPDVYTKTFIKDDIILMTSDGLTNMIKESEIYDIVKQDKLHATENLVKQANENGGYDNITVVIIM